jgi:transcriptional regulator with XRE-family HTH domain
MKLTQWLKAASAQGWQQTPSIAGSVRLACKCQGCPETVTRPENNLGPIPDPCTRLHEGQYAGEVVKDYRALVLELVRIRKSLGLSQEDVAAAAGLADGHLNKLEAFARTAQPPTLQLWAMTLGRQLELTPAPLPLATQRAIERRTAPLRETTRRKGVLHDRSDAG